MTKGSVVLLLVVAVPAWAQAQGLGDAAARERQKRQAAPAPAKVFTEADLAKGKAPEDTGDAAGAEPETEPGEAEAKDPALADLEEQFRRTGLPPGWARQP